jgi:hypothetical protein
VNIGHGAEAAQHYLTAAAAVTAAEALELRRRAAMQFLFSGHVDEGLAVLTSVLKQVHLKLPTTPRRALWSFLARRAQLRWRGLGFRERSASDISAEQLARADVCWTVASGLSMIDAIRGADFQLRSLLQALRIGEPCRIVRAMALLAGFTATSGGLGRRRAAEMLQKADAIAQRIADPYALGFVALASGMAGHFEGRWKAAREYSDKAERIFRDQYGSWCCPSPAALALATETSR